MGKKQSHTRAEERKSRKENSSDARTSKSGSDDAAHQRARARERGERDSKEYREKCMHGANAHTRERERGGGRAREDKGRKGGHQRSGEWLRRARVPACARARTDSEGAKGQGTKKGKEEIKK